MNKLINSNKFLTYYVLKIIKLTFSLPFATPGNFTALMESIGIPKKLLECKIRKMRKLKYVRNLMIQASPKLKRFTRVSKTRKIFSVYIIINKYLHKIGIRWDSEKQGVIQLM